MTSRLSEVWEFRYVEPHDILLVIEDVDDEGWVRVLDLKTGEVFSLLVGYLDEMYGQRLA